MAVEALQTKLNKALVTNTAGDYALRTVMDGEQDLNGNYLLNDQTTTNMMSKGTVYRFDGGTNVIIAGDAQDITTNDFAIHVKFKPDNVTAANAFLVNKEAAGVGYGLEVRTNDLWIRLDDGTTDVSAIIGTNVFSAGVEYDVFVTFDRSGNATAYVNGVSVGTVAISTAALTLTSAGVFTIGAETGGTTKSFAGEFGHVAVYNFAPTADQVKSLISGNIPFKWQYGSQTDLVTNGQDWTGATGATRPNGWTSVYGVGVNTIVNDGGDHTTALKLEVGATENPDISQTFTAVIGKEYTVSLDVKYVDGTRVDIGVGSVALTKDYLNTSTTTAAWTTFTTTFIATTVEIWIDIRQVGAAASGFYSYVDNVTCFTLGAVALYDQTSISETYWGDVANNNDGAVTGATVLNQPDGMAFKNIILSPVAQDATPKEGQLIYNSATNKLNVWTGAAWEVVTSA